MTIGSPLSAVTDVFDGVLGGQRSSKSTVWSFEHRDMDAAPAQAREKLAARLAIRAGPSVTSG
jgi:hypothetical protein